LLTETVVLQLPLSILWGNTLEVWPILALNYIPSIVGEEWEWYLLEWLNPVPHHLFDIRTAPPHGHPALVSSLEPIVVIIRLVVAYTIKPAINQMTHRTDFQPVNLLHAENANVTHLDQNSSINKLENR
jgi:hypothetical protein